MDEPTPMYSAVRDKNGDIWGKGRKLWSRRHDGIQCHWFLLDVQYGPLTVDAETYDYSVLLKSARSTR